ncbi:MFS transporter [Microbacterium sp. KR10-403]|uniref:MFS transporter n=1 Tax=Microbacterium sp. KR10-403 TaxID=3158581 RepID=UPI0032E3767B
MKRSFQNSVWAIRDARIALSARALSTAGTSVTSIAAILLLHNGGVGALGVAAFLAALVIPAIATMGLSGRVVDTMDSRVVLVVASLVQATAVVALGFAHDTAMIFVTGVVISLAQSFEQPTWSALVPRIVGEDRIGQAISWQQGLAAIASPIGAGLGGLLVTLDDVAWGFWADAATYVLLAAGALIIRTRRHMSVDAPTAAGAADEPKATWTAGLRIVMRDRIIVPLFIAILVFVVLVEGINPVEVFLVRDALGASNWQYGLSEFFAGAGGLIGAAIAGRIHSNTARARAATIGFGSAALVMIAAGAAQSFWIYAVMLTAMIAAFGTGNATFGALLTSRTPDAQRGRVYAALNGLARTASLIALGLGGVSNALLGPRATFVVAGIAGALAMAVASVAVIRAQRAEAAALAAERAQP